MAQNYENEEKDTVTLTLEDDSELECAVLTTFEADGKSYIALLPIEGIEAEEGEVFLYRFVVNGDDEPELENIESDEEYEAAAEAFDEWLDEQEYDEIVGEDFDEE